MSTDELNTSADRDDARPSAERRTDINTDSGSWIDTNDVRDSPRPGLRVMKQDVRTPKPPHANALQRTSHEQQSIEITELKARVREVGRKNDELNSMIEGTGIATVFLDSQLRVVRFTREASMFGWDGMAQAMQDAREVLETRQPKQAEICAANGRWYRMYIHPHGPADQTDQGVVISFLDITEQRREAIETAKLLADKEVLLKEVHHRVRNNTASIAGLLSIQLQSITDSEARSVLQSAIGRVESMSFLYDRLLVSEKYGASSVKNYLNGIADSVMGVFSRALDISVEKNIADFDLDTDNLFILGLICNELLTNVMKYAFEDRTDGVVTITLVRSGDRVTLIVQDDGVGLTSGFDPATANGFGLTLVRMLSEQMGGSFSVSGRNGTRSVLEFTL